MKFFKKMIDYSVDRVRGFGVFEMALFKVTMFFLGIFFAVSAPKFCRRNRGPIAVVTAILTGTFLGYFFFGERYFEIDPDGDAAMAKKKI